MSPADGPPPPREEPQEDPEVAHFRSIPWCAAHLAAPGLTVAPVFSRTPKPRHEDALFARTLRTPDTVRAFVCFYPRGGGGDEAAARRPLLGLLPRAGALASLGHQVSGYGGVAHGGVVACLFDEALALLHPSTRWRGRQEALGGGFGVVTAYLNTTYLRPVATPGDYLITVRLKGVEGRKVFVEGWMEDETGETLARAEALFIESRGKL